MLTCRWMVDSSRLALSAPHMQEGLRRVTTQWVDDLDAGFVGSVEASSGRGAGPDSCQGPVRARGRTSSLSDRLEICIYVYRVSEVTLDQSAHGRESVRPVVSGGPVAASNRIRMPRSTQRVSTALNTNIPRISARGAPTPHQAPARWRLRAGGSNELSRTVY